MANRDFHQSILEAEQGLIWGESSLDQFAHPDQWHEKVSFTQQDAKVRFPRGTIALETYQDCIFALDEREEVHMLMRDSERLTRISEEGERVKKVAMGSDCLYLLSVKAGEGKLRIFSIPVLSLQTEATDRQELFTHVNFQPENLHELDQLHKKLVVENTKYEIWDLDSQALLYSYQKKENSEFFYTRNHAIVAEFTENTCNLTITSLENYQTRRVVVNVDALYLVDVVQGHLVLGMPGRPVKVVNLASGQMWELRAAAVKQILKLEKMNDLFFIYSDNVGQFALKTETLFGCPVLIKAYDDSQHFLCLQEKNSVSVISGNARVSLSLQGIPKAVAVCEDTMEVIIACKDGTIKVYH